MTIKKTSLEQSKNIQNLKIDTQKYNMILNFASKVVESDAFDPEVLSYAELNMDNYSHICLVNFADIHFFDQGMSKSRFDKASEFLKNTTNAYAILSGDTFTVSTLYGASNVHINKINNTNAAILGEKLLANIKSKIVFGLGVNHDGEQGSRNRDSNISLTRQVLKGLDIPYFQYNVLLKINIHNEPFYVFVTHGNGKSSTKASALDTIKQKCMAVCSRFGVFPNLILTGHFHSDVNGRYIVQVPVYNKNGLLVSTKAQEMIIESAPALQGDSEFTTTNNMDVTKPNVNAFDISFKRNPYFNPRNQNSESPIIWSVNKFPILRSQKDTFSTPSKIYMEKYFEPQTLKSEVDNIVNKKGLKMSGVYQSINTIIEEVKSL